MLPAENAGSTKAQNLSAEYTSIHFFGLHAAMPCAQNEKLFCGAPQKKTLVNRVLYSITDFQGFVKSGLQILTTKSPAYSRGSVCFKNYASSMVMTCSGRPRHICRSRYCGVNLRAEVRHLFGAHFARPSCTCRSQYSPPLQTFIVSAPLSQLEQRTTACFFQRHKADEPLRTCSGAFCAAAALCGVD